MRHKFLVLTVKNLLKSVYIYGSYRKIKTGLSLFWTTLYMDKLRSAMSSITSSPASIRAICEMRNAIMQDCNTASAILS